MSEVLEDITSVAVGVWGWAAPDHNDLERPS